MPVRSGVSLGMELEVLSVSGAQPDQVPLSTLDPFQPSRSCPSGRVASGNRPRLRRLGRPVACSVSWRFMALHLVLKAFSDDFESSKGLLEAPGHTLPTLRCGAEPLPGGHPAAGAAVPRRPGPSQVGSARLALRPGEGTYALEVLGAGLGGQSVSVSFAIRSLAFQSQGCRWR